MCPTKAMTLEAIGGQIRSITAIERDAMPLENTALPRRFPDFLPWQGERSRDFDMVDGDGNIGAESGWSTSASAHAAAAKNACNVAHRDLSGR